MSYLSMIKEAVERRERDDKYYEWLLSKDKEWLSNFIITVLCEQLVETEKRVFLGNCSQGIECDDLNDMIVDKIDALDKFQLAGIAFIDKSKVFYKNPFEILCDSVRDYWEKNHE